MSSAEPWKTRCPNGHAALRYTPRTRSPGDSVLPQYRCLTCGIEFDEPEPAPEADTPAWKGEVVL
jgi:hypothetical protein